MKPARLNAGRSLVVLLLLGLVVATWVSPLDQPARASVDAGLARALVTFASARGLNGVISVVQGTEFNVGVGAGATFAVGEILDPVNDLVEQFSDLMLLATVSFGIQEVLLVIGGHGTLKVALTALLLGWAALTMLGRGSPAWLTSLLILGLMLRFAIPVASAGADLAFEHFLADRYQAGEAAIASAATSVQDLAIDAGPDVGAPVERGGLQGVWEGLKGRTLELDPRAKLDELRARAEAAVENVVWLIVVFVLQTLIIPLAVLGALWVLARNVLSARVRGHVPGPAQ